ncbi:hypothetical protein PRUPE_2G093500 [Prunus persica]|uniref:Uncharacterized protein n=1 Tax=Prunus persica TaxID=3760 RepID=A0A251QDG8_PRUPE|nr:hypothetical protein PRUPE_2G093500 [Prunus persica]
MACVIISPQSPRNSPKNLQQAIVPHVGTIMASDMEDGCRIEWTTLMSKSFLYVKDKNFSYHDIHSALGYGFELQFRIPIISSGAYFPIRSIFGVPFLAARLIYKRRKMQERKRSMGWNSKQEDGIHMLVRCHPLRRSSNSMHII